MPARFPKTVRVRSRAEYSRVFEHAKRIRHAWMTLHYLPPQSEAAPARLGYAVSRKVDRRAVERNRIKRLLRETFRQRQAWLRPGDWVVVIKPLARNMPNDRLADVFVQLLQRASGLPKAGAAGKMGDLSAPQGAPKPVVESAIHDDASDPEPRHE